jgi:glutamine synthetase
MRERLKTVSALTGSSIRGWAAINESDMLIIPDPATCFMDPFAETRTLVMAGDIIDPITRQHYDRDPRWIAQKAELYLEEQRLGGHGVFRRGSGVLYFR